MWERIMDFRMLIVALIFIVPVRVDCQPISLVIQEISRVMPPLGTDALHHHFKIVVSGVTFSEENVTWTCIGGDPGGVQFEITTDDCIFKNEICDLIYPSTLPDLNSIILLAKDSSNDVIAAGSAFLELRDLQARVAVVGSNNTDGFLRVQTGILNNVTLPGGDVCQNEQSPCYYSQKDLNEPIPEITRCNYLRTTAGEIIKHCDETYTEYKGLSEEPTFSLFNNELLTINYLANASKVEVLLVDPVDGSQISNADAGGVNCTLDEMEANSCLLEVDIPVGKDIIRVVVIPMNEDDFVLGSEAVPFEIFYVTWSQLATDTFMTTWTSSKLAAFTVFLTDSDGDTLDPLYQFELSCGKSATATKVACEAFFTNIELDTINTIIVKHSEDMNTVEMPFAVGENKPGVVITRITKNPESVQSTLRMDMETSNETPTSGRLIEVIFNYTELVNCVYNNECQASVSGNPDGYAVQCTLMNYAFVGEKYYIWIAYNASSNIQEVGLVYTTLKEIDVELDFVGDASLSATTLWASGTTEDMFVNGVLCESEPCFLLEYHSAFTYVPVCIKIVNAAIPTEEIDQCVDLTPTDKGGLMLTKFQLMNKNEVSVTASYTPGTTNVYIILYNASRTSWITTCMPEKDKICTGRLGDFPQDETSLLKALVVGESIIGEVTSSTTVEVEDLLFSFTRLFPATLVVEWTANNPEGYTSVLQELYNSLGVLSTEEPADVLCMETSCSAFYSGLNESSSYSVIVHKIGSSVSETIQTVHPSEVADSTNLPEIKVTKVTKVTADTTMVNFGSDSSLYFSMDVVVSMMNMGEFIQFISEAEEISKEQIKFNHIIPIFDAEKEVSFVFAYYDLDNVLSKRGLASVQLKDLDARLAWVNPPFVNPRSLRVDVGSQNEVVVGVETCHWENSPCYFLEDSLLPSTVERCEEITNSLDGQVVLQCDSEITLYAELKGLNVSVSGNNIKVNVPVHDPEDTYEVIIYDPKNTSAIFSEGNATCATAPGAPAWECTQRMRGSKEGKPVRILVIEIGPGGDVLKSAVSEVTIPSSGVENWVIAVSVLASVLGAALLAFVVIVVMRKKKSKKSMKDEVLTLSEVSKREGNLPLEEIESPYIEAPIRKRVPPPVPMKPIRRNSKQIGEPYADAPRRGSRLYSGEPSQSSYFHGQRNYGYEHGEHSQDMPPVLPRLNMRMQPGLRKNPAPGYY
ncbi:hypothetical protein SK128_008539 [Halocaridina rubra]|uniref:Fibronectin type-III domain-containing protein n=1 Tax=Halocaridina rubra TaxID=373956 RepID=A0AAN8ZW49_HALRR